MRSSPIGFSEGVEPFELKIDYLLCGAPQNWHRLEVISMRELQYGHGYFTTSLTISLTYVGCCCCVPCTLIFCISLSMASTHVPGAPTRNSWRGIPDIIEVSTITTSNGLTFPSMWTERTALIGMVCRTYSFRFMKPACDVKTSFPFSILRMPAFPL